MPWIEYRTWRNDELSRWSLGSKKIAQAGPTEHVSKAPTLWKRGVVLARCGVILILILILIAITNIFPSYCRAIGIAWVSSATRSLRLQLCITLVYSTSIIAICY
jgi:hypothetical protein